MKVTFAFLTGLVHIPPRSRNWPNISISALKDESQFRLHLEKPLPLRNGTHPVEGTVDTVTDAQIPILVTGEWLDSDKYFATILRLVLEEGSNLIELLRTQTQQAQLRLRGLQDLQIGSVASVIDETFLPAETTRFHTWFRQITDKPLPYIDRSTWSEMSSKNVSIDTSPALYESLLLDAEVSQETDPRVGILFSALACEVFIQSFLQERAAGSLAMQTWLNSARNPDSAASIHVLYDLGLRMVAQPSLKEHKGLHAAFSKLITARNDIAHRAKVERIPGGYTPEQAIATARKIIEWVMAR